MSQRQEAVNIILAQMLQERGLVAAPEQILSASDDAIHMPDVIVDFQGLRLAIEAEFGAKKTFANKQARIKAFNKAQSRVSEGIAHIGVAIVYPQKLKDLVWSQIRSELLAVDVDFAIVNEVTALETQFHLFDEHLSEPQFFSGKIEDFVDALRRSYEQLVRDDTLEKAVAAVEGGMAQVTYALKTQPATTGRLAEALGIGDYLGPRGRIKSKYIDPVNRISCLIITNALIFHEVLSSKEPRVKPVSNFRNDPNLVADLGDHWDMVLRDINYFPIFATALHLLRCFTSDADFAVALKALLDTSLKIVSCRASLRHDLAGRIYHRLLEEAKFLGAYYTAIPSAALLLKLALDPAQVSCDWKSIDSIKNLKIADLACGTGTLLMASADVVTDNYIRAATGARRTPTNTALQQALVEHVIHGYDVLASAVHLTASTLTLRVPEIPVDVTHLYAMPLGGRDAALGSLEFLANLHAPGTLFGVVEQIAGKGKRTTGAGIPSLDLCVMNPPFTRSVGGNLLFGNLPDNRHKMQKRLKKLVKSTKLEANITAGLGPVFVALGDRHLKDHGTLALVLPKALLSGPAWAKTREIIASRYHLEYVITCHEPGRWNFSENTKLSEVMIVARRRPANDPNPETHTIYLNLHRQLRTSVEALAVARLARTEVAPDLALATTPYTLILGKEKYGEMLSVDWQSLKDDLWGIPASFASFDLNKALYFLRRGQVYISSTGKTTPIPLRRLGELVTFGYDARDVHDAFERSLARTPYPALWGHQTEASTTLSHKPNAWLAPRSAAMPGRKLKSAAAVHAKAGRMLFAERLRLNTVRTAAIRVSVPVTSNTWWPASLKSAPSASKEKALVLWQNSTLGILMLIAHRVETEGAWVKFKKPVLSAMPALDVSSLNDIQLTSLAQTFDDLQAAPLLQARLAAQDTTRKKIDDSLSAVLNLPDLGPIRSLLIAEPVLCLSLNDDIAPENPTESDLDGEA